MVNYRKLSSILSTKIMIHYPFNSLSNQNIFIKYLKLKELLNEKNELLEKIERLEKSQKRRTTDENNSGAQGGGSNSNFANDKKRVRRSANQIERNYRCPISNCEKSYGSENSLIQHVKLKHPEADLKQIINQINLINQQSGNNAQGDDQSQDDESSQQQQQQKKKKVNDQEEDDEEEEEEDDE